MNILITGNLTSIAPTLAKELAKEKNKVVLAGENIDSLHINRKNVIIHSIDPSETLFQDVLSSYNFDFAIYCSTREEQLTPQINNTGQQLDALRNTLDLCKVENIKRFFYISSTEVYGNMKDTSEITEPQPASLNGHAIFTGEKYCMFYQSEFGVNTTIVRLSNVYGPEEFTGLLYGLVQDCKIKHEVMLPGSEDRLCGFLYIKDVIDFIRHAMDEEYGIESQIVNLPTSSPITNTELVDLLKKYFPNVTFGFAGDINVYTKPASGNTAKKLFNWIDIHDMKSELGSYVDALLQEKTHKTPAFPWALRKYYDHLEPLKWLELFLGAIFVQYLSESTGTLIQFKYVDFRLLFVVVMGSLYGVQIGLLASILVSLSVIYTWYQLGFNWALLIYNVGNWFPFAFYFAAGLITGFSRDKTENAIMHEQKQSKLIYDKYEFLYGVFDEIRKLKDEFREQLIGYRDSFGKIYTITRELDTLQEQTVFFRALSIIEDLMQNYSIAIYSLDREYARLEVNSYALNEKIAKSLKLADFPELLPNLNQGVIFQNTSLLPHYPAYVAPVLNNSYPFNVPVAIVVIWSVKFDQYSTYYLNLFKVICGLIQDALLRATLFMDLNYEKMYVPSTKILTPMAFMDALRIRADMKKNKITDYQLLKVTNSLGSTQDAYSSISEGIRSADIVGMRDDGNCYILLSQADQTAAHYIISRLDALGIQSDLINADEFLSDDEIYPTMKEILSEYPA